MTEATLRALTGLRDLSTLQWYVIPFLALVFYIYVIEIGRARAAKDWNVIVAGAAVFGADFFNETWNSWVMVLSGRSALWTAPGPTALRTLVGWNIEIMFMFSILGIIWYRSLSGKPGAKILGLPEGWALALGYSLVCVVVEWALNIGGLLIWEYGFWTRTIPGSILIYLIGYLWFFAWAILAVSRPSLKAKIAVVVAPYAAAIAMNIIAAAFSMRY